MPRDPTSLAEGREGGALSSIDIDDEDDEETSLDPMENGIWVETGRLHIEDKGVEEEEVEVEPKEEEVSWGRARE